ncbi:uncharacterized protein BDCG_02203 [Blastomyces dermatitidis ER-3]|uniref:Uncharacterized protein n=2 Tax=Blastomyces TaxID=229219 RepID=A0A179UHV9_BLAGS|nr:uncharacterized protein BDBG_16873 [Blastomyces gilchristii SLH14081]XP_045274489.1 uncharacterized protein BDCG_02203 [Blastomyces dermatitidis ER-3]EEQ87083.2 hypothetical protein BDCG_02203 [Blastomyces dermatitidis ER-3]OAT07636.1 hypothetical protein BDBG_16873 [Blastomyces gilchristii SLH14081]
MPLGPKVRRPSPLTLAVDGELSVSKPHSASSKYNRPDARPRKFGSDMLESNERWQKIMFAREWVMQE